MMSSVSVVDFGSSSLSMPDDEASNQSIEIPDPPVLPGNQTEGLTTNHNNQDDVDKIQLPLNLSFEWFDEQVRAGVNIHRLLRRFLPTLSDDLPPSALFEILMDLFLPVRERQPLEQYQTLDDAVQLIRTCKNILVLTGAGISVSCGSESCSIEFCKFLFHF